jgi:hypothetical protein
VGLAVALSGVLVSGSFTGSFMAGMRVSMLISTGLLLVSTAAVTAVLRERAVS